MAIETLSIRKELDLNFDDAIDRVSQALAKQGFGILTEIDVKDVFKKKLDVDFRRYRILGACNPQFAMRALTSDLDVGVMLPCSVVVYETNDAKVAVAAVNPIVALGEFGSADLRNLAQEVRSGLQRAVDSLPGG